MEFQEQQPCQAQRAKRTSDLNRSENLEYYSMKILSLYRPQNVFEHSNKRFTQLGESLKLSL